MSDTTKSKAAAGAPKKTASKASAKKPAAKKAVAPATKPAGDKTAVSPLERWRMIAEAAYYRAEKRGFVGGNPMEDWAEAEKEINARYSADYSKLFALPDAGAIVDQLKKLFTPHAFGGIDLSSVIDSQRKNVEAVATANQDILDSTVALIHRQNDVLNETVELVASTAKGLAGSKSPREAVEKQGELIRVGLSKTLEELRAAIEAVTRTNTETLGTMKTRFEENLREMKDAVSKLTKS
jgi:phasin family protein